MNTPLPSVQLDPELETARATLSSIDAHSAAAPETVETEGAKSASDSKSARSDPSAPHASDGYIDDPDVRENDDVPPSAEDFDRLKSLENGELYTADEFQTELMELFGFKRIDGELDAALLPAMELIRELDETGEWSPCGIAVAGLLKFMRGHRRAFGRYFDGPDMAYPRPSNVIQAEMDRLMPGYVSYLQDELALALEEEAPAANSGS